MTAELALSVVLPTYNEAENVPVLVARLAALLADTHYEIIVADDDSPDRTWEVAERLREKFPQLRVLRRRHNRGLYPAVVDGFAAARGSALAVIDADLQHDETLLPKMLAAMGAGELDLVVGSRYVDGGGTGEWGLLRRLISRTGTALAGCVLRHRVKDPLSGFFMLRAAAFARLRPRLNPQGFKILLDVLAQLPREAAVRELPYTFKPRQHGESKLGGRVALQFARALLGAAASRLRA